MQPHIHIACGTEMQLATRLSIFDYLLLVFDQFFVIFDLGQSCLASCGRLPGLCHNMCGMPNAGRHGLCWLLQGAMPANMFGLKL